MKKLENINREEVKTYELYIPKGNVKMQKHCKRYLSPSWNNNKKCWEVVTSLKEIEECNLDQFLQAEIKEEKVNSSEVGNFGTGCLTTREKALRYGYDAIEN